MTTPRIPKIAFPVDGKVSEFIAINRLTRRTEKLPKTVIEEVFNRKMSDEDVEEAISFLKGKIFCAGQKHVQRLQNIEGKEFVTELKKLETKTYG